MAAARVLERFARFAGFEHFEWFDHFEHFARFSGSDAAGGCGRPSSQGCWQVGHQKRLRAARSAVRMPVPQMWQGMAARR